MFYKIHKKVQIIWEKHKESESVYVALYDLGLRTALKNECKHLCAFALSVLIQNEDVQVQLHTTTHTHTYTTSLCAPQWTQNYLWHSKKSHCNL